jgi:hypothetical protein
MLLLHQIIEGWPIVEPEAVVCAFTSACDLRSNSPVRFPAPTEEDWAWYGRYAAQNNQSWMMGAIDDMVMAWELGELRDPE